MAFTHISKRSNTFKTQSDSEVGQGDLLRRLKGAPLSVLVALGMYGAQTGEELAHNSGYTHTTVSGAVKLLTEMGLVERRHYRCWSLKPRVELAKILGLASGQSSAPETIKNGVSALETIKNGASERAPETITNGVSESEAVKNGFSELPHDHDGVQDVHDDISHEPETDIKQIMDGLSALEPPFENAGRWLREVSPGLVGAWLAHLDEMDREARARIRNEAAFVRAKVTRGEQPPAPRRSRRPPCASCGRDFFDGNGGCLVCAGVVRV